MVVIRRKVAEDSASVYVQICCVQLSVNVGVIVIAIKCEALCKEGGSCYRNRVFNKLFRQKIIGMFCVPR